jgi:hypothetical protein
MATTSKRSARRHNPANNDVAGHINIDGAVLELRPPRRLTTSGNNREGDHDCRHNAAEPPAEALTKLLIQAARHYTAHETCRGYMITEGMRADDPGRVRRRPS